MITERFFIQDHCREEKPNPGPPEAHRAGEGRHRGTRKGHHRIWQPQDGPCHRCGRPPSTRGGDWWLAPPTRGPHGYVLCNLQLTMYSPVYHLEEWIPCYWAPPRRGRLSLLWWPWECAVGSSPCKLHRSRNLFVCHLPIMCDLRLATENHGA